MLPDLIFEDIMMMIGLESLCHCRKVCSTWNAKIMSNIWGNPSKRSILTERVGVLMANYPKNSLSDIACAASLAHYGMLGPVRNLMLCEANLASVPAEHLAYLVSCVTSRVTIIDDDIGSDLIVTILNNVRSEELEMSNQNLETEETEALVRAMESYVERLTFLVCPQMCWGEVILDIRVLTRYLIIIMMIMMMMMTRYNGQGRCRELSCYYPTSARYGAQLKAWAHSRHWSVTQDDEDILKIERM